MDCPRRDAPHRQADSPAAGAPPAAPPLLDGRAAATPAGEFLCPGCRRPLAIALPDAMCFAAAQVYCPDCERDYRERRGRWAE